MALSTPEIFVDGLTFPEGPRWRKDALWFSDILAGQVKKADRDGDVQVAATPREWPSGLGFLPDGTLVLVSMGDGKLMALRNNHLEQLADMMSATGNPCNDMVVAKDGTAFVGSAGPGLDESRPPGPDNMSRFGYLVSVPLGGKARIAADRMTFPNGMVITPDGKTLIVSETFAFRLTAFDIEPGGGLSNRRVWADIAAPPDGITLDEEGCLWVACPYWQYGGPGGYVRIAEGGELKEKIDVEGYSAYACTLGGDDMRTLYLCESAILGLPRNPGDGRIRAARVDVPGTGSP